MNIYVAGKWQDRKSCKDLMKWLESLGHKITLDWTDHKYEDEEYPKEYCKADVQGVIDADILIGLFERPYVYRGALVEMGIALGQGKPIHLIGTYQDDCIFANHPSCIHYNSLGTFKVRFLNEATVMTDNREEVLPALLDGVTEVANSEQLAKHLKVPNIKIDRVIVLRVLAAYAQIADGVGKLG